MNTIATLVYSPGVRVVIETAGHGIIDISDDLQAGQVTIHEEMPGTARFTLLNHRRKYDGIFTPNDTINVHMKRFRWLPVFSGYLDQVPFFSVYSGNIEITATDTLKRLKYRLWDPGTQESVTLLNQSDPNRSVQNDGGMRDIMQAVLSKVGKWPTDKIHIGRLPEDWAKNMEPLQRKVWQKIEDRDTTGGFGDEHRSPIPEETLPSGDNEWVPWDPFGWSKARPSLNVGIDGVLGGRPPGDAGETIAQDRLVLSEGSTNSAATGVLPTNTPVAVSYGSRSTDVGRTSLTGESLSDPADPWYCRIRVPCFTDDGVSPAEGLTRGDFKRAKAWWTNRTLLVTNPKTFRSVVLRVADFNQTPTQIGIGPHAMRGVLGAQSGDPLDVRFAPATFSVGKTFGISNPLPKNNVSSKTIIPDGGGSDTGVGSLPWEDTPDAGGTLQSNANAARAFIKANWNISSIIGYSYRYISGTNTLSNHAHGLALDVFPGGSGGGSGVKASGEAETIGNSVALWFAQNPNFFSATEVIWMDRIITESRSSEGWRSYGSSGGGNTQQHRDHVHISFADSGQTSAGSTGGGWSGATAAAFNGNVIGGNGISPGSVSGDPGESGDDNILEYDWNPHPNMASQLLTGYRALMNDTPLLTSINIFAKASMRSFMAGPNGDFISWFPDYFGTYGLAATMNVRDIELAGDAFSIVWDDSRMTTHQFAYGSLTGFSEGPDGPSQDGEQLYSMMLTKGVASVEFPELMQALFNVKADDPRAKSFYNPEAIFKRFGARVKVTDLATISTPEAEFWYACREFQKNWAQQFSASVRLTFMPEVWPGMLLKMETFGFQAYVEQVIHSFDYTSTGFTGGFKTSVNVIAPSSTDGSGLFGLPKGV